MTPEQFDSTYRQYLDPVSRFLARRVDFSQVDELTSQVFEIAWNKRSQPDRGHELPWLYKIAGFVVANHRRKQANEQTKLGFLQLHDYSPSAESIAVADLALAEAIRSLSATDQSLLALVAFDDLEVREAAKLLGLTANAASIRLNRARKQLREKLQ